MELVNYIWAWLAVWLSGIWVAIGQWFLWKSAVEVMWKRKEMTSFYLTITILGIALVESAVIYGLIVAFQILDKENLSLIASIWVWLSIWLAWLWAWVWEWKLIAWALRSIDKNPEIKWKIMTMMVLFVALVESAAIYWLVISFKILWLEDFSGSYYVGMWLSIWLAGMWVAIGMWILSEKTMEVIGKRPDLTWFFLTATILGIALVESAAIYWLVVAFDIAGKELPFYFATWAGAAIGLAWLWAWVWEWILVSWALNAMARNPAIKGKMITFMVLFVALVEVTAIYGLIIAFKVTGSYEAWAVDNIIYLASWLAIGLAWLWVGIWRWYLSEESLKIMWKSPKMISFLLTVSILWVALVESAAIYALIVSFQILSIEALNWLAAMWAWLAIGLAWLWAWVWEWLLIKGAINGMNKAPESKWKILAFMVLFVALVEVVAIYGLIIAFKVMN